MTYQNAGLQNTQKLVYDTDTAVHVYACANCVLAGHGHSSITLQICSNFHLLCQIVVKFREKKCILQSQKCPPWVFTHAVGPESLTAMVTRAMSYGLQSLVVLKEPDISDEHVTYIFSTAACFSCFMLGLLFDPDDRSDSFLSTQYYNPRDCVYAHAYYYLQENRTQFMTHIQHIMHSPNKLLKWIKRA